MTKEYLKERFATGEIPTGEDYDQLLDSYWHKTELGQVEEGDEQLVTGGQVFAAIKDFREELLEEMRRTIAEALPELLGEILAEYVTGNTLSQALNGTASQSWVTQKLAEKVDAEVLGDALAEKVNISDLTEQLAGKVDTSAMAEALAGKVGTSAMATALEQKADCSAVYTKAQIDNAMAARPTQTEMANELGTSMNDLPSNETIQQMRDKINDLVTRTNTLSHVACGSASMSTCPSDISQLT